MQHLGSPPGAQCNRPVGAAACHAPRLGGWKGSLPSAAKLPRRPTWCAKCKGHGRRRLCRGRWLGWRLRRQRWRFRSGGGWGRDAARPPHPQRRPAASLSSMAPWRGCRGRLPLRGGCVAVRRGALEHKHRLWIVPAGSHRSFGLHRGRLGHQVHFENRLRAQGRQQKACNRTSMR